LDEKKPATPGQGLTIFVAADASVKDIAVFIAGKSYCHTL